MESCLDKGRPEDVLLDRLCKLSGARRGASQKGWDPPCLDASHTMGGSNWADSTGQGKGKITPQDDNPIPLHKK